MKTGLQDALGAYRSAAASMSDSANREGTSVGGGSAAGADSEFLSLVKDSIQQARAASQESETKTAEGLTGQADLIDVVTAVSNAEITLQTVVTVRDKVLESYQEILRMPI